MDVKDADAFESPELFCSEYPDLSLSVAVILLKVKLPIDLISLKVSALLSVKVPREMLDRIQLYIPRSPIIGRNNGIMGYAIVIQNLEARIENLFVTIAENNQYFWPALLDPGRHLTSKPGYNSCRSRQKMQVALRYVYDAWVEMLGAIDWIRNRVKRADESSDEVGEEDEDERGR